MNQQQSEPETAPTHPPLHQLAIDVNGQGLSLFALLGLVKQVVWIRINSNRIYP